MKFKKLGNEMMAKKNNNDAIEFYVQSLSNLCSRNFNSIMPEFSVNEIKIECLNNISICFLFKKDFNKVLDFTQQVRLILILGSKYPQKKLQVTLYKI